LRGYRIVQPVDNSNYLKVDLDFDSRHQAEPLRAALTELWGTGLASSTLAGEPQAQILKAMENEGRRPT
jgi:hypothetical protein